jgi:hypothetical protein
MKNKNINIPFIGDGIYPRLRQEISGRESK